jgi:hypothetical protein
MSSNIKFLMFLCAILLLLLAGRMAERNKDCDHPINRPELSL